MRSDVSEFLKTSKASQLSVLIQEAKRETSDRGERPMGSPRRLAGALLAFLGVLAALAGLLVYYWTAQQTALPVVQENAPPAPLIFFSATTDVTIAAHRTDLVGALQNVSQADAPAGTLERLVIRVRNDAGGSSFLSLGDFFRMLEVASPPGIIENAAALPQFFIQRGRFGPRFGIIFEAHNAARAFEAMFSRESSLQRDLEPFFLGRAVPTTLQPFGDITYKNVSFRYLTLDRGDDTGIGYLYFPARSRIIIATSEESMRIIIDRLFETR